ncbi:MAG: glycosyltransferase family 4 protein [Endomicrobiales bacterium]|nr:glycosyltransferase family 4 protein [Endomicrobiales bacterium]
MPKIKIAQIITRLEKGGSAENTILVCERLDPAKFEPILVYGSTLSHPYDITFKNIHVPTLVRRISPLYDVKAVYDIYRILKTLKPDIVHTNSSKAGFIGRWAAFLAGIKNIVHTPHGHVFYGYEFGRLKAALFVLLERMTALITTRLVALTEGEMKESIAFGVGTPKQWRVIHCGVEIPDQGRSKRNQARDTLGIGRDTVLVGTVSRLDPVKGVINLVKAAPLIIEGTRQEVMFLIVGDGTERQVLVKTARDIGVQDKIIFTGMRKDVPELMSAMDIYVQPSLNEGLGKTLVEAHGSGLPVVASSVQGIPDVVLDGRSGFLVPPGNPGRIADAVLKLVADAVLRRAFGEAGKCHVTEKFEGVCRFSPERMIGLLEKLYDELFIENK